MKEYKIAKGRNHQVIRLIKNILHKQEKQEQEYG
jgi:hypothetical protein